MPCACSVVVGRAGVSVLSVDVRTLYTTHPEAIQEMIAKLKTDSVIAAIVNAEKGRNAPLLVVQYNQYLITKYNGWVQLSFYAHGTPFTVKTYAVGNPHPLVQGVNRRV